MSDEIQFRYTITGETIYATVVGPSSVWANNTDEAMEAVVVANWAEYVVPLTETDTGTYFYVGNFPNWITTPGIYSIIIYRRVGGSPAITDTVLAKGTISWTGVSENAGAGDGNMDRSELRAEIETIIDRDDLTTQINTRLNWALDWVSGLNPWRVLLYEDTTTVLIPGTKGYSIPAALRSVQSIRVVSDTDKIGVFLEGKDYISFQDDHPYPEGEAEAQPTQWTLFNDTVVVVPVPGIEQTSLVVGTDANNYRCILNHTAAAGDKPTTGGSYTTYWTQLTSSHTADTWASGTAYFCQKLYMTGIKWPTQMTADGHTTGMNRDLDMAIVFKAAAMCFDTIQEIDGDAQYWETRARVSAAEAWTAEEGFNEV